MKRLGEAKWNLMKKAGMREDDYYLETLRTEIRGLMGIIRSIDRKKKVIEEQICEIADQGEEMNTLKTFPVIGGIARAMLLNEIGDIDRFEKECCRL